MLTTKMRNFLYYYLIGVAVYPASNKRAGELFLKYNPIIITKEDNENIKRSIYAAKNEMFPTTQKEANNIFGITELASNIHCFLMSCRANNCSVHIFYSNEKFDKEYFKSFIELANKSKAIKEKLYEAQM